MSPGGICTFQGSLWTPFSCATPTASSLLDLDPSELCYVQKPQVGENNMERNKYFSTVGATKVSHQGKTDWWVSCQVSIPKKQQWLARITPTALNWFKACVSRLNYVSPGYLWYQGSFPLCLMLALQLQSMGWGNGQADIDSCSKCFFLVCFFKKSPTCK